MRKLQDVWHVRWAHHANFPEQKQVLDKSRRESEPDLLRCNDFLHGDEDEQADKYGWPFLLHDHYGWRE